MYTRGRSTTMTKQLERKGGTDPCFSSWFWETRNWIIHFERGFLLFLLFFLEILRHEIDDRLQDGCSKKVKLHTLASLYICIDPIFPFLSVKNSIPVTITNCISISTMGKSGYSPLYKTVRFHNLKRKTFPRRNRRPPTNEQWIDRATHQSDFERWSLRQDITFRLYNRSM